MTLMESLIAELRKFRKKTGHYTIPVLNFEIFLNFPHFLRSYVLSLSATCTAACTFSF